MRMTLPRRDLSRQDRYLGQPYESADDDCPAAPAVSSACGTLWGMTQEKITLRTIDGDVEQSLTADEVIIVLPNGIEFSLFAGDEGDNEVVALITATEPLVPHRFVLRPGAVNQVGIGAE